MSTREIILPSLLARIEYLDTSKPIPLQFLLGVSDWTNDKETLTFSPQRRNAQGPVPARSLQKNHFAESQNYTVHAPQS